MDCVHSLIFLFLYPSEIQMHTPFFFSLDEKRITRITCLCRPVFSYLLAFPYIMIKILRILGRMGIRQLTRGENKNKGGNSDNGPNKKTGWGCRDALDEGWGKIFRGGNNLPSLLYSCRTIIIEHAFHMITAREFQF